MQSQVGHTVRGRCRDPQTLQMHTKTVSFENVWLLRHNEKQDHLLWMSTSASYEVAVPRSQSQSNEKVLPFPAQLVEVQVTHSGTGLCLFKLIVVLGHSPYVAQLGLAKELELLHRLLILVPGQEVTEPPLKPLADPSAGGLICGDAERMDSPVQKLADGVAGGVLQARRTSELLRAFRDFAAGSCHGQRDAVSSVVRHLGERWRKGGAFGALGGNERWVRPLRALAATATVCASNLKYN